MMEPKLSQSGIALHQKSFNADATYLTLINLIVTHEATCKHIKYLICDQKFARFDGLIEGIILSNGLDFGEVRLEAITSVMRRMIDESAHWSMSNNSQRFIQMSLLGHDETL